MRLPIVRGRGFTFVELMAVIGILGLIASLVILQLVRARVTVNEHVTVVTMRDIVKACQLFMMQQQRYPNSLLELGLPTSNPPFLQTALIGDGTTIAKNGYTLTYAQVGGGTGLTLLADPSVEYITGVLHFYIDQLGVPHRAMGGPASSADPVFP